MSATEHYFATSPTWVGLAESIRLGQEPGAASLIEGFLAESHRLALCAGCGAWSVREECYRLLLATALDERLPWPWRQLCQDYAWQALEELQRLSCASTCPHRQQTRLQALAKLLDRAIRGGSRWDEFAAT